TRLEKGYSPAADVYQTAWSSIDVDCEACHGPGSAHVAAPERVRPPYGADARAWTLAEGARTATLAHPGNGQAEIETCALCHSRRTQIAEPLVAGVPMLDQIVPVRLE